MGELAQQTELVVGLLAAIFVEPALAVPFLVTRKRQLKARRRSAKGSIWLTAPAIRL